LGGAVSAGSFEVFYVEMWPWAVRVATLITQSQDAGPEIAQESLIGLFQRWGEVEHPKAYLRRSIVNQCQNWQRRERTRQAKLPLLAGDEAADARVSELGDAIRRLPDRQRAVLVLRYYGDLTESEIAEALGCRRGTVKSLASRALSQLRKEVPR
jgi:RNA polymerase sigma-70 factor (sigma-E family)